ncbi:hypothetical protein VOLCADRAFT_103971 [Volvox carteri f. nagariensis]|uniref:Uncharacterized protein n=1 Tax=Volvox carteri f. nagariensis TaxID=3068 RepID=D8TQF1_VOLCA|nr:uncharacterized protein VOLCADRAFT_103971 [Volvox carteri f. nagariensis]EFJ50522.1 hypothetical protein VOLCADRAFT_103971 [Volvox carteri f. nagariensis]|eukprot:XP_002948647.1 hypothetical protein VOLCADRAFT_103971 [Volvox carteri f. nagariensis]
MQCAQKPRCQHIRYCIVKLMAQLDEDIKNLQLQIKATEDKQNTCEDKKELDYLREKERQLREKELVLLKMQCDEKKPHWTPCSPSCDSETKSRSTRAAPCPGSASEPRDAPETPPEGSSQPQYDKCTSGHDHRPDSADAANLHACIPAVQALSSAWGASRGASNSSRGGGSVGRLVRRTALIAVSLLVFNIGGTAAWRRGVAVVAAAAASHPALQMTTTVLTASSTT